MKYFRAKNLKKYQHYAKRTPPWIKVYNDLLDNYNFACLQDASKLHLIMIWLLASRSDNCLPYDEKWLSNRINATDNIDLQSLINAGFIEIIDDASKVLAECKQSACLETETETETETDYPRERASHAREANTKKKEKNDLTDRNGATSVTTVTPSSQAPPQDPDPPEGKNPTDYESKLAELQELVGIALIRKNRAVFDLWLVQYDIDNLLEVVRKLRKWYVRKNGKPPYSIKPYDKAILQDCNRIPTEDGIVLIADLTKKMKV